MIRAELEDGYRPFIRLEVLSSNGRRRSVRCNIDTGGGGGFQLSAAVAAEIGVASGDQVRGLLDGAEVDLDGAPVQVVTGTRLEAQIGPRTLSRYCAVFDFPAGTLELRPPDGSPASGERLDMPLDDDARFPRIEVEVAGESLGMLLDTGAMYTMISEAQISRWREAHSDWRTETGARGDAVMGLAGEENVSMLWLPELRWGSFSFTDVGVVGRREGVFEEYMSQWMPAPIVGALGNNVLRELRLELDYVSRAVYVSRPG